MTKTIEQLKADVEAAREAHSAAVDLLNAAMVAAYRFKVGDIIINERKERRKVTVVNVRFGSIRMMGRKPLKSGEWGNVDYDIYSYNCTWNHWE